MTTTSAERPTAVMAAATRSSRFSTFTTGNSNGEKNSQGLAPSFAGSSWQTSGIWGNSTKIGPNAFNKRDAPASQGSDDTFSNGPSGSSALAASSEADPWVRPALWNSENPSTRNTSGSTSPKATRDGGQSIHDLGSTPPYFSRPAIGQGSGFGRSTNNATSLDPATGSFKYGPVRGAVVDDEESSNLFPSAAFSNGFSRVGHDSAYLNMGASTRDPSMPASSHSENDAAIQNGFDDSAPPFGYQGVRTSSSGHSHRPSITGPSGSFGSQAASNSKAYHLNSHIGQDDLPEKFKRSLGLTDAADRATNGAYSTSSQTFQFNPGSQAWDTGLTNGSKGYGGYPQDVYTDSLAPPFLSGRKGVHGDRTSPASSVYRQSVNSPRSYGGTPTGDPWSRPQSRDLRMAPEDRRGQNQQYMQQQAPAFYTSPYYNPNFPAQYPAQLFDPYTGHPNFRPPIPMTGYPVNPYLAGAAGAGFRSSRDNDPGKGVRSLLLDEFRSSSKSNKRYELKDIYNHVVEFSGDQHGSRFIQQKLETANSDEKDQVFREIEPNAVQLMKDVFGNYVIQKFFEHGNQVQKKVLAAQMKGKVVDLSTQMYACRVVQKALEHVLVEQQAELVKELEPDVVRIIKDQNGNHVIQKIIELVPRQYIGFIMDSIHGQVSQLASHTYGCRVIQRMLEHGSEADKASIMEELHACAQLLITDQYGNYVTQHVIQHGKPEDRSKMIRIVTSQLLTLSKHKFASNVVEKCIEYGNAEERRNIRSELTSPGSDGTSPLQLMMKDQYGNYVIQKLLNQLDGPERESFIEEMKPQFHSLKKVSTGRQIAAIDRLISAVSSPTSESAGSPSGSVNGSVSATTPGSPALPVDNSVAPTPVLTMEPNSPQSSSPPSTNASAVEENINESNKAKGPAAVDNSQPSPDTPTNQP
ncbi:Pumilio domain-containing protein [Pleurostoma richardsiae]|uniref:Pumilio homology domain family member 3 n=1 Tax=Pleurostoma richardsiae TaxID=41990 RepID=A0AA38S2J7_9PEZI|nr:Pumilio domain-containing protein [Pleurostoma richardsiae]